MDMINVMNTSPMVEGNNWWIATLVCVITRMRILRNIMKARFYIIERERYEI